MRKTMKTLEEVEQNDPLVNQLIKEQRLPADIIVMMANRHRDMVEAMTSMIDLVPRRVKIGDTVHVWHCPDHLIPIQDLTPK